MPTIRVDVAIYWVIIGVLLCGMWFYRSRVNCMQFELDMIRTSLQNSKAIIMDEPVKEGKQ